VAPSVEAPALPRQEAIDLPVAPPAHLETQPSSAAPIDDRAPLVRAPRSAPSASPAPSEPIAPRVELSPQPEPPGYPATGPLAASETEVSLLSRAQEALGRDPARALDLVRDHEQRFDMGLLVQEREVIAIEALVRLGRKKDAEARAAAFHARFPRSAHGRRIDVLLQAGSN
jgi:hypothetical protein